MVEVVEARGPVSPPSPPPPPLDDAIETRADPGWRVSSPSKCSRCAGRWNVSREGKSIERLALLVSRLRPP